MANKIDTETARCTLKAISKEVIALESSSIISLYEIDISDIKKNRNLGLLDIIPDKLRFHNMESLSQRVLEFRSDKFYPLPILTDRFEIASDGSLPRPTITFASMQGIVDEEKKDTVSYYFKSLRRAILELDNLIGGKVTRIRTFYKFLDANNNLEGVGDFTCGLGKNPEFPRETYYVQRKISEDKNGIQLELSSVLDLENFKLPARLCLANRCPWTYRGEGCCYEFKEAGSDEAHGSTEHLPHFAPPIATDEEQLLTGLITGALGQPLYDPSGVTASSVIEYDIHRSIGYTTGNVVYITKDDIRYYYVAKTIVPSGMAPPPHTNYWEADRCSKTLEGCKLRWGNAGAATNCVDNSNPCPDSKKVKTNKFLPFGGYPGTNSKTIVQ
ncbi:phage minor tail protein L [bacterium]|nr:phage minor tail protein L [bacterium]